MSICGYVLIIYVVITKDILKRMSMYKEIENEHKRRLFEIAPVHPHDTVDFGSSRTGFPFLRSMDTKEVFLFRTLSRSIVSFRW